LGLILAAGFNVYIKVVIRQRRIPFDMALSPLSEEKQTPNAVWEQAADIYI